MNEKQIINSLDNEPIVDWGVSAINAPKVWDKTKGEGVKVAVIDTGIDTTHPDLKHAIKKTIDLKTDDNDPTDEYGHGTHVAGLIAGRATGVAPEAELYIAKVLNENGFGRMVNILDGITFAINYEVDILCMSLGTESELPLIIQDRLEKAYNKGITIVCATGNRGVSGANYPARLDNVIGVGGADKNFELASFSNYGLGLDVIAPAVDILSTYKDNNYARITGTSMASPLVAGGIALVKSYYRKQCKELSPQEIKNMIKLFNGGMFDVSKLIG